MMKSNGMMVLDRPNWWARAIEVDSASRREKRRYEEHDRRVNCGTVRCQLNFGCVEKVDGSTKGNLVYCDCLG